MRLAKLCITLALALCGWHAALASALCARHADCHASASPRAPHAGHATPGHSAAHAADRQHQAATTHAAADPPNDPKHRRGHYCGASAESPREVARAASSPGAGHESARGEDENGSPASLLDLRSPGSSCEHCVGRQTGQPPRVKSAAPAFARDAHAAPSPVQQLVAPARPAPRARFAPTEHSPPRGRPLHLLNSALLI